MFKITANEDYQLATQRPHANLSAIFVEAIVDEKLGAGDKVDVGLSASDAGEDNARRWTNVVRVVVELRLTDLDDCFESQH